MKAEEVLNDTMHGQSDHVCVNKRCNETQNKGEKIVIILLKNNNCYCILNYAYFKSPGWQKLVDD
jgi:hypothetical protein